MTRLGYREKIDALHAAMALVDECIRTQRPFDPTHPFYNEHYTLDTWNGVQANLMGICNHFWEHEQRGEVDE